MIKNAIDIISQNSGLGKERINIDEIDLEDPATFDTICSGNLSGIFQLETSSGMRQIARDLAPRSLEDISALIALYRPGPLDTGMIDDFIARKSGKKPITFDHPLLETILKNTYGTIVYQEQIMQITQVLAGFSLGEADLLRRAMGKKKPEVLLPYKDKFIQGCKNNFHPQQISEELSEKLFEQMLAFAEYCFNKSHSTAYGFVTYQTAYLKTHYPVEYLTSLFMSANGDTDRIKTYIIEAVRLGIKVTPPNINLSEQDFSTKDGKIFFGLKAVKGVGDAPSQAIILERNAGGAFKDFWDFCSRVDHKIVNKKTLESLIKCGAFDGMGAGRKAMIENLESFTSSAKRVHEEKAMGQFSLFSLAPDQSQLASPIYNNGADDEYPERDLQSMEYELLGLYVNNHPMQGIQTILETVSCQDIKSLEDKPDGAKVSVAVLITDFVKKLTKAKKSICILNLEDMESRIEGVLFSRQLNDYEALVQKGKRVLIKGTVSKRLEGDSSIMVESIEDLDALGTIEINLDVDKLSDYYQFFHSLKSLIMRSEHQGSKILIINLFSESSSPRKLSCGPKFTISDSIITREAIQSLINRFSSEILAGVSV
jgi:DNA polymerase-3 subunit alpha